MEKGDLENGERAARALANHLTVRADERNAKWRHRFYDLIATARLCQRNPRTVTGPDDFAYYALDVPEPAQRCASVTMAEIVERATTRGRGAMLLCGAADPWVFSCGDLVTQRAFGTFEFPRIGVPLGPEPVMRDVQKNSADVSIGAPPATLLPGFVQPLLHRYFTQRLGIAEPGVLALLSAQQHPPEQLVFRLSRADFRREDDFATALAGVSWFLPRHIVVSVLPPDVVADLDRAFVPLTG